MVGWELEALAVTTLAIGACQGQEGPPLLFLGRLCRVLRGSKARFPDNVKFL